MKTPPIAARTSRFNRFQTAIAGLRYVPTAINAHFDPYHEPAQRPNRTLAAMEAVPRIAVEPPPQRN